jgi:hypothetical protein
VAWIFNSLSSLELRELLAELAIGDATIFVSIKVMEDIGDLYVTELVCSDESDPLEGRLQLCLAEKVVMVSIDLGKELHYVSSLNKNVLADLIVYPLNSHKAGVALVKGVWCKEAGLLVESLLKGIKVND